MFPTVAPMLLCGPDPWSVFGVLFGLPLAGLFGLWMLWRARRATPHRCCFVLVGSILTLGGLFAANVWIKIALSG